MKKNTNQFNGSHADRINNGGGRFRRIALFPLMLLTLLLVPTSMVAQTDYDNTVTFTALAGSPEDMSEAENYHKLFDGKKKEGNSTKWCCNFYSSAYVIFKASKAGIPVGYTITTGNDNSNWKGRNPKSWKLYGNNEGQNGNWTLIQEVNNDTKLQDVNYTSYDFTCGGGKSYKYFKWEISAIHSGDVLQVGEFELKLQTCTHTNADGTSALGDPIENVETTCTEHGYTTYNCSICHSTVKKYKTDELKKHTLTHHEAKDGVKEHWQCDVCHKYFSDANATQEVSYASLLYQGYAVFDQTSKSLTFSYGAKPEGAYDLNEGTNSPAWWTQRANIEKVVFDASFANARPTSCYYWFSGCENLTQIEGLEYLNTEEVTNMSYFFKGCSLLTSLNISNFNTAKVTDMSYMFTHCWGLESLDVSILNTEKVTNMESMFLFCNKLTSLDVSNFKTENVTNMSNMFRGCRKLTSLDVYSFNTEKVTDMLCMFTWCDDLTTIYVSDKFVTTNVQDCVDMFDGCYNLKGAIEYDSNKTDYKYANYTTGYFTLKPSTAYVVFDATNGTLTFRYDGGKPEGAYDLNEGTNSPTWAKHAANIKKVVFAASFAKARPTSCYNWFRYCEKLTQIEGIENLNTEEVTDMSWMFMGCKALASLDVTHFNTAKVTDMGVMFNSCSSLTSLDVSNFNTAKVTDMYTMFHCCSSLKTLDLTNFNTANVTDLGYMFEGCSSLKTLDLTNFNTEKVTSIIGMFHDCSSLTTIYVSDNFITTNVTRGNIVFDGCTALKGAIDYDANKTDCTYANYTNGYFTPEGGFQAYAVFDADNSTLTFGYGAKPVGAYDLNEKPSYPGWVAIRNNIKKVVFDASFAKARPTSCYYWFSGCDMLTQIEGIEHLNTEEVTDMSWMFMDCRGLTSLDVSHFNTQKVTNMEQMFNRCSGLTSLEVSNFNTENVTNMTCIFLGCSGLTSLDVSHFNTEKVTDMSCMFYECGKLTSLDVSHFNTGNVTKMGFMFFNCSALTLLDLTNFNTAKVVDMGGMLILCSALTTIYVSDKFVTTNVTERGSMFYGCTSLKGAIAYDENKFDDTYANYETGYFSKLVGKNGDEKIGASGETLTAASLALDDEKDFVAYEPFTATTATYNREMKAGTAWATLCLPFDVSLADKDFRAFKLLSANESTSTIQLEEITTSITAGTPVIIKMNNGETTLSISEANKEIAQKVVSAADGNYQLQGIYTQKVFDKVADNNCYIVKGDKLMNPAKLLENTSTPQVGSKPFRAYMVDNTSSSAGAKMFSIAIGDNTTAIDSLNTIADDKAVYYDLQGNRLSAPQKGINIVKRGNKTMKVIIK